ncbi:unnamed protein product [Cercopithifilaria johnstoni]|uniref:Uncharacterized protein n=1 Tax=Cercopithifilaria johnstoni TaxID=2874296 RepID=A0A8J2M4D6_9BILA|nr:unnamed protein product [Cercopithifilaria johnstoni]
MPEVTYVQVRKFDKKGLNTKIKDPKISQQSKRTRFTLPGRTLQRELRNNTKSNCGSLKKRSNALIVMPVLLETVIQKWLDLVQRTALQQQR